MLLNSTTCDGDFILLAFLQRTMSVAIVNIPYRQYSMLIHIHIVSVINIDCFVIFFLTMSISFLFFYTYYFDYNTQQLPCNPNPINTTSLFSYIVIISNHHIWFCVYW